MAEHNTTEDAEAAFLNALKAVQELDDAGVASESSGPDSALGLEGTEIGVRTGGAFREQSDQVEEDNHLKSHEPKEVSAATSGVASLLPGAVASSNNGPSSINNSTEGDRSPHRPQSIAGVGPNTQESSAHSSSSATPVRGAAMAAFGAFFPDENDDDPTPPTISVTTTNAGSNDNDSRSVSASAHSAPAQTLSDPVPVQSPVQKGNTNVTSKRKRLPQDIVGQLEDRIAEDSRGDIDAWLSLIEEHKRKGKFNEVRAVYERFFVVFPAAANQWISYVKMELANNELQHVERIFQRSLLIVPNVELWSLYLDYIRRRNNLTTDTGGKARSIVSQSYEFVLNNVGCDREAGRIWSEYVQFVKSAPGNVGGSGWQDQQKMDSLRKVYQKAVTMPVHGVEQLWREYDQFEQNLNKLTARKFLQERSPLFMTARGCLIELSNITKNLRRDSLPRLPPAPGYEGYEDFTKQVELWKNWIQWEKGDPLVLAKEDPLSLKTRVIYVFKQALMALRFWPEIWFDAAEWCFANGMDDQGLDFLTQGMAANPESCLLHFKFAERLEATIPVGGEEALVRKGQMVRKPYDDLLNMLYSQVYKIQQREKEELARLEESFALSHPRNPGYDDDEDDPAIAANRAAKGSQSAALKESSKAQIMVMSKTISAVWINLMRSMRRIQGHGKVNEPLGGSRQIFADARKRGKITSDVYVASALIEYHCYKDPAALKIFERGSKLFPEDEEFALEYLKHLVAINDITNARAVFETFVGKAPPEKSRKVYQFFYEYESHYGELGQMYKLEKRMSELYPSDPYIGRFSNRYSYKSVDPCSYIPVVSPIQQCRPKSQGKSASTLEYPPRDHQHATPLAGANGRTLSPKRPANEDLSDSSEHLRPRKLHRPDSPLKGAAGRRLDQQKRAQQQQQQQQQQHQGRDRNLNDREDGNTRAGSARSGYQQQQGRSQQQPQQSQQSQQPLPSQQMHQSPPVPPLPELIMYLLTILPGADKYQSARFRPEAMVGLLSGITLSRDSQSSSQSYSYSR